MKKNNETASKTLKLDVETVRHLAGDELNNVVGGIEQAERISLSVGCNCSENHGCKPDE